MSMRADSKMRVIALLLVALSFSAVFSVDVAKRLKDRSRVGANCSINKSCAACILASGSSTLRGTYECWWDKAHNVCGSQGTNWFHTARKTDANWVQKGGDCSKGAVVNDIFEGLGAHHDNVRNKYDPEGYFEEVVAAGKLKGDLAKIKAVAAIFRKFAVIDCGFSDGSKAMCKAHTFNTGIWSGCNHWTVYESGCNNLPDLQGTINKKLPMAMGPIGMKLFGKTTGVDKVANEQVVLGCTEEYWKFCARWHAGVCATYAGAGLYALKSAGVEGHLQWVRESYGNDGHEYIVYGMTGADFTNPTKGAFIIDFWYDGLGNGGDGDGIFQFGTKFHTQAKMNLNVAGNKGFAMEFNVP